MRPSYTIISSLVPESPGNKLSPYFGPQNVFKTFFGILFRILILSRSTYKQCLKAFETLVQVRYGSKNENGQRAGKGHEGDIIQRVHRHEPPPGGLRKLAQDDTDVDP